MSSSICHPNMERLVARGSFWSAALQISTWRRARLTCSIADLSVGGRLLIFGGSFIYFVAFSNMHTVEWQFMIEHLFWVQIYSAHLAARKTYFIAYSNQWSRFKTHVIADVIADVIAIMADVTFSDMQLLATVGLFGNSQNLTFYDRKWPISDIYLCSISFNLYIYIPSAISFNLIPNMICLYQKLDKS